MKKVRHGHPFSKYLMGKKARIRRGPPQRYGRAKAISEVPRPFFGKLWLTTMNRRSLGKRALWTRM
jgi:hypothetical protein